MTFLQKVVRKINPTYESVTSYSQLGEDVILYKLMKRLGLVKPTYLDIGASDPIQLNNTYLLYTKGIRGVLVEPNPALQASLKKHRPKDTIVNVGVGFEEEDRESDFYIMDNVFLSSFSKESAEQIAMNGKNVIKKVIKVPLVNINHIIQRYFKNVPNVVSLDIESLDYEVLKSLDWSKYRPEIFCVETLTYTQDNTEVKTTEVMDLMAQHNYLALADTYINTIFVDREKWSNRR